MNIYFLQILLINRIRIRIIIDNILLQLFYNYYMQLNLKHTLVFFISNVTDHPELRMLHSLR